MNAVTRKVGPLAGVMGLALAAAIPALAAGSAASDDVHSGKGKGAPSYKLPKADPKPDKGKEPEHAHGNKLPKSGPPAVGKRLKAQARRGRVTVKLPGSKKPVLLEDAASVPVGSVVDVRKGAIKLIAANGKGGTDFATFSGAVFKLTQGRNAVTQLALRGRVGPCKARKSSSPVAGISRKRRARKLWGRGKGRFRTRGRYGAATVRGTVWLTKDTCKGTLVRVRRGEVGVRDFAKKKTVTVEAGERYLAKKRKRR